MVQPGADVGRAVLSFDESHVSDVQAGLGLVTILVGVAQVAVDLAVRALGAKLDIIICKSISAKNFQTSSVWTLINVWHPLYRLLTDLLGPIL